MAVDAVVLGGGLAGLTVLSVLQTHTPPTSRLCLFDPLLNETPRRLPEGLFYLRATEDMLQFFKENLPGVTFDTRRVRGGIFSEGRVVPRGEAHQEFGSRLYQELRILYTQKTRNLPYPQALELYSTAMNDPDSEVGSPFVGGEERRILVSPGEYAELLTARALQDSRVQLICDGIVELGVKVPHRILGSELLYEETNSVFSTVPLPSLYKMLCRQSPVHRCRKLMVMSVRLGNDHRFDDYDYVYFPAPGDGRMHRIAVRSLRTNMWDFEIGYDTSAGPPSVGEVFKSLAAFPDLSVGGFVHATVGLAGHLLPTVVGVDEDPLPASVHPVGRFAQWDSRMTLDRVARRARDLVRGGRADGR